MPWSYGATLKGHWIDEAIELGMMVTYVDGSTDPPSLLAKHEGSVPLRMCLGVSATESRFDSRAPNHMMIHIDIMKPALMAMMDIVDMLAIVGDSQLLLIQSPVGVEGRELDFVLER